MTRDETLQWIDIALGSMDRSDLMALIDESRDDFDGEFFPTIDSEMERYRAEGDEATANRLEEIARAVAAIRQNRAEKL